MSKSATIKPSTSARATAKTAAAKSRLTGNTKIFIGTGAVILVLGGAIIAAMPESGTKETARVDSYQAAAASPAGELTAFQKKFNFGSISMAGGKVTHRYPIRNAGSEPILIRKMYTSCMCTTAALVQDGKKSDAFGMPGHTPIPTINVPIKPREEVFVEVVFDPAAHGPAGVGPIERVVTIENNAGRPVELAFSANVTP